MRAYSPQARSTRPQCPYFKVQVFDGATMAWKDKQKRYNDELIAWAACPTGGRLMRVDREGRYPVYYGVIYLTQRGARMPGGFASSPTPHIGYPASS